MIFKHRELESQGLETPAYKLSAIVGADSFFYAIESGSKNLLHLETHFQDHPLALFHDPFDFIADLMSDNSLLFESFDKKCFGIVGAPYMIVPSAHLRETSPVRLLAGMTHIAAKDTIRVQQIPGLDATCIFAIPEALRHEIEMYFESPVYHHVLGSLLHLFSQETAIDDSTDRRIHLHSIGPYGLIIGIDHGKVAFHNQFRCVGISDLIYFTCAVLENLGWAAGDFKLFVSGHRRSEILADSIFDRLFSPSLSAFPVHTQWPESTHDFLDLIAISQCAS